MVNNGIYLIIQGIGGFILPLLGVQFKVLSIFGESGQYMIALVLTITGLAMTIKGVIAGIPQKSDSANIAVKGADKIVQDAKITVCPHCGSRVTPKAKSCGICYKPING